MVNRIENLVFEGGGILGIAYLGVLEYLFQNRFMRDIRRTAGTSAGAITACITSFNLPFPEIKAIADSLDYKKVPYKEELDNTKHIPNEIKHTIEELFDDIDCVYRLIKNYGWFSTGYFYSWIKTVIGAQFDPAKKLPPYTFSDFKETSLHKQERPFYDLYIIGTDLSNRTSRVFSYDTTPLMEVAQAVRISMSIPLFFEAVAVHDSEVTGNDLKNVFCDGGVMNNYPLSIFDFVNSKPDNIYGVNMNTLGVRFNSRIQYTKIDNLLEFVKSMAHSAIRVQQDAYHNHPIDKARSINIDTLDVSPTNFDVSLNDNTYRLLYNQGYAAAETYFSQKK